MDRPTTVPDGDPLGRRAARTAARRALELASRTGGTRLRLSLSHHGASGAAALSTDGRAVGVDLERNRVLPPEHERYFLTRYERAELRERYSAVECWALKEAAWKALRCSADAPLTSVELRLSHTGHARLLHQGHACTASLHVMLGSSLVLALVQIGGAQ